MGAARCRRRYAFRIAGTGHDLGIDAGFAKAAGNQLRVLRTKVENQQTMAMNILCHALGSAHRSECLY